MKTALLLCLALCALCLPAPAEIRLGDLRIGDTPARKIAKDLHIPGKFVPNACYEYSQALEARLRAAHIPCRVLGYEWSAPAKYGPISGAHAVVEYCDDGRLYIQDNEHWLPIWIHDEPELLGLVAQFAGPGRIGRVFVNPASRHLPGSLTQRKGSPAKFARAQQINLRK